MAPFVHDGPLSREVLLWTPFPGKGGFWSYLELTRRDKSLGSNGPSTDLPVLPPGLSEMTTLTSHLQVIQKLRPRCDSQYHQVIPSTGAGDVEQVSLRVVDLFEIRIIGDGFDSLL